MDHAGVSRHPSCVHRRSTRKEPQPNYVVVVLDNKSVVFLEGDIPKPTIIQDQSKGGGDSQAQPTLTTISPSAATDYSLTQHPQLPPSLSESVTQASDKATAWISAPITITETPSASVNSDDLGSALTTTSIPTSISSLTVSSEGSSISALVSTVVSDTSTLSSSQPIASSTSTAFPVSASTNLATNAAAVPSTTASTTPSAAGSSIRPGYLAHNPPFYIAIALGAIALISCLAAIIAWAVRLHSRSRRRKMFARIKVPWDDSETRSLEEGNRRSRYANESSAVMQQLRSLEDLASAQSWEPRGDRDVGEPRRAGSLRNTARHPVPIHDFFTGDDYGNLDGPSRYTGQYAISQPLPAVHAERGGMGTGGYGDIRNKSSSLIRQEAGMILRNGSIVSRHGSGGLQGRVCNLPDARSEYGTPREAMHMPRFLALEGDGLKVPWNPSASSNGGSSSVTERLRNRKSGQGQLPSSSLAEQIPEEGEAGEGWTMSLKSNLVNAFNAVAANLGQYDENDNLTPIPRKRSTARKALQGAKWDDGSPPKDVTRANTTSSQVSKAWSLEEHSDGTGVVRFHLGDPGFEDGAVNSVRTLGDESGQTGFLCDEEEMLKAPTHESVAPLVAKRPEAALLSRKGLFNTNTQFGNTLSLSSGDGAPLSRASSVYSTASDVSSDRREMQITRASADVSDFDTGEDGLKAVYVNQESLSTCSSASSDSASDGSGIGGQMEKQQSVASRALKERLRNASGQHDQVKI